MARIALQSLAGIEYGGIAGCTKDCIDAVRRRLQYGDSIKLARILSANSNHCLLLTDHIGDLIAIKSGFGSGYSGEGSRGFSYVLQLLECHGAEIEEYDVGEDLLERIDKSALRLSDVKTIEKARPLRPMRWHDYIFEREESMAEAGALWDRFPFVIPFALVDSRLIDIALGFWDDPDAKLIRAYRRLEDIVRRRTGIDESGARLFSQAFLNDDSPLEWSNVKDAEQKARGSLLANAYRAYRNPRAHQESTGGDPKELLDEFLLVNHLYRLERASRDRQIGP